MIQIYPSSSITWKSIPGYEGDYEVSDTGLVRTSEGKTTHSKRWDTERKWEPRILKEKNRSGRDVRVDLWKDGKPKSFLVHRLVALAFLDEPPQGKMSINHIDGNPRNNEVANLEWCDHADNNNHAFDNDLMSTNVKIRLTHIDTQATFVFRSMSKASEFMCKNVGYVSLVLKRGQTEADGYIIEKVNA